MMGIESVIDDLKQIVIKIGQESQYAETEDYVSFCNGRITGLNDCLDIITSNIDEQDMILPSLRNYYSDVQNISPINEQVSKDLYGQLYSIAYCITKFKD